MDDKKLYTWDELYERAEGAGFGDPELTAKDNARSELEEIILWEKGVDINECECPEEEIDAFLYESEIEFLFDENGRLDEAVIQSKHFFN